MLDNESRPKIDRDRALSFVKELIPECADLLLYVQNENDRLVMQPRVAQLRQRLGSYVTLYINENHINNSFLIGVIGLEAFKDLNNELTSKSIAEQEQFLKELTSPEVLDDLSNDFELLPTTEFEWEAAIEASKQLPPEQQQQALTQGVYLFRGLFAWFFNMLSLMVHGTKLTALVPAAVNGDDDAFLKAVQIDRLLLLHYPYFVERKQRAQDIGDTAFLRKLAVRESCSPLRSKIRYPALYALFGLLESLDWLDDLRHEEILDLAEEAKLDRFQSRIEDVNYLTKRLIEYRRWRKTGGVSMH